ncbi:hypothetical protein ACLK1Z_00370 [Escherichia coli]
MQRVTKPTKNCFCRAVSSGSSACSEPNIRDDELTAIESNRQQVMESLDQAGWRLMPCV